MTSKHNMLATEGKQSDLERYEAGSGKMKPSWEMTLMAEDIFKAAVAQRLGSGFDMTGDLFARYAESAIEATKVWKTVQKKHKFPDTITVGKEEEDG